MLLAGCLDKAANDCGGGITCPLDKVCLAGGGCALPEQLTACDGAIDGASCTFAGGVGTCVGGVCVGSLCGNGDVDPGEQCDDGNTTSGDGCRNDCLKVELCGDGVLDQGEGCDDGNTNPADGCDACAPTTWRATAVIGGNANATTVGMSPAGVAIDRRGDLYIADTDNSIIRRVDASGVITTVAGTGVEGFGGDGGAATSAQLDFPFGVAADGLGNLYIADTFNNRVRRVDANGLITTVAGGGAPCPSCGVQGFSGDGGAATSAQLDTPIGVAVDGLGNLYIADQNNLRVRRVDTNGIITTMAGSGPTGNGNGGFSGDGGPATSARLNVPDGIAVDGQGNLYIADTRNHRIRRVDTNGLITTVAGDGSSGFTGDGGPALGAGLGGPQGVAVDGPGNLYITDGGVRIRRVDVGGVITTVAGIGTLGFSGDGGAATSAQLGGASGVAVDGSYVYWSGCDGIRRVRISDFVK